VGEHPIVADVAAWKTEAEAEAAKAKVDAENR
jgi:hypothetical protein